MGGSDRRSPRYPPPGRAGRLRGQSPRTNRVTHAPSRSWPLGNLEGHGDPSFSFRVLARRGRRRAPARRRARARAGEVAHGRRARARQAHRGHARHHTPVRLQRRQGRAGGLRRRHLPAGRRGLFKDPTKVEFVVVTGEGRWPAIESGRADIGVGGTTTYPDRAVRVAFTRPFIDSGISILVTKKSGIKTIAGLNNEKNTVANLNNPQMAERAKKFFPKAK